MEIKRHALIVTFGGTLFSCGFTSSVANNGDDGSKTEEIIDNLATAGFPADDIMTRDGVVYVGRDAAVSLQASRGLRETQHRSTLRQYRTNALISNSVTTICVNGATFDGTFSTALDAAIANYNHLGLGFRMQRTSGDPAGCSTTINAVIESGLTGGVSGFPAGGLPFGTINIGDGLTGFATGTITHVITHELGHTIGLRHSDFFDRSISCGTGGSEGASDVGAILIPGTPSTAAVGGSIMNSCFRTVETGQFTDSDVTALVTLYPPLVPPRIGVLSGGDFLVKEGGLSATWVDEFAGVTKGVLSGDRIGVLSGGHFLVKEGDLSSTWVDEFAGVDDAALSGNRIGVLSGGHFLVKEGDLSTAWVDEFTGVTKGLLSGDRIGVLSGSHLFVKEGGLSTAWVDELAGVDDAALSGNRIGVLSGGHFLVKEGGLSTAWVDEFAGVTTGVLPNN